ncbi:MAG: hypothetical protein R2789_00240 [Microthrixaceae bacterium]
MPRVAAMVETAPMDSGATEAVRPGDAEPTDDQIDPSLVLHARDLRSPSRTPWPWTG